MGDFNVFENREQAFNKPIFVTPDWAKSSRVTKVAPLGPTGPVGPDELVDAAGQCAAAARAQAPAAPEPAAPEPEAAAPAAPLAKPVYGSVAGDLAGPKMPRGAVPPPVPVAARSNDRLDTLQPAASAVAGGIALGMTECETVRRGGQPSNVNIGAGDKGARKVVLTYLSGPWPGIYTFDSGRLKEIDAAPVQPKPEKPSPKNKKKKAPAPQASTGGRVTVQ
jgi:hypothetical protein